MNPLIVFFGVWVVFLIGAQSMKWKHSGAIGLGGGFLLAVVAVFAVNKLTHEGTPTTLKQTGAEEKQFTKPIVAADHNYVMQDGLEYGYPAAVSEADRKAGQVAEKLVMVYYAGEREGKLQVHILDGTTISAFECARPCEYLKIMSYFENPYLDPQVNLERIAASPGSIGYYIMQDAMNGKLHQYARTKNGKRYDQWMDERKGMLQLLATKK